jgi:glycosyltransferase involved in cell wall biosynthesis
MKTDKPTVSVVIPTHNRAALLARAIRSVQGQTYPYLEIIIVDDASIDNTRELVESLDDKRIRYLRHETNLGGSAARNTGIHAATGEVIAFLDDDDEWMLEKTEEQLKIVNDYEVVVCTSVGTDDELPRYNLKETLEVDDLRQGPWGGTGVLMARAKVLKETIFDESLPRGQDWDLFIRLALKHKIAYLNKPLLRYNGGAHVRITNSILNVSVTDMEQQCRVIHKHKRLFGKAWFERQMCQKLLYDIKHRTNRAAIVVYAARNYGVINVVRTLGNRLRVKLSLRFRRFEGEMTSRDSA